LTASRVTLRAERTCDAISRIETVCSLEADAIVCAVGEGLGRAAATA